VSINRVQVSLKQNDCLVESIVMKGISYSKIVSCFRKERFLFQDSFKIKGLF